ncbi:MAG TPA: YdcF family protein [Longimicrobium sp.]|nr:YdcF family protein [Longimicrobium sp.]
MRPGFRRTIRRTAVGCAGLAGVAAGLIVGGGMRDDARAADVAVVLGTTANPDGTPSPRLAARLDAAAALYRRGLVPHVIVSGGVGREGVDEAAVMKRYLVQKGIPSERIIPDSRGINTAATAKNAAAIMRQKGWTGAVVVSQYFHIPRCRLALRRQGISPVYSTYARYFEPRDLYSIAREMVGYPAYLAGARD